uniref:Uncharacterized protein n=1 Tax=Solanum lycopersicum TaxID=4081 RepID=A0A3Q7HYD4_SOLLC
MTDTLADDSSASASDNLRLVQAVSAHCFSFSPSAFLFCCTISVSAYPPVQRQSKLIQELGWNRATHEILWIQNLQKKSLETNPPTSPRE